LNEKPRVRLKQAEIIAGTDLRATIGTFGFEEVIIGIRFLRSIGKIPVSLQIRFSPLAMSSLDGMMDQLHATTLFELWRPVSFL
jgi:hypothetical protein